FLRIAGPIAETGAVVVAGAEPAIVDHEERDSVLGGLVGERLLTRLVDDEGGRLPRVIEDGAEARREAAGEDLLALEAVHGARRAAEARVRVAGEEGGSLQRLAGLQW